MSVLVVESDRRVRTALINLLMVAGDGWVMVPTMAPVAQQSLDVALPGTQVALVDVAPPHVQDALALIRSLSDRGVAVVALSAHDAQRYHALAQGAVAFLPWTSTADALVGVVRESARQRFLPRASPRETSASARPCPQEH